MSVKRQTVDIVTDGSGNATAYTTQAIAGRLLSVHYQKDGTTPFDNTVDFTITTETTLQNVWVESNVTASKTVAPRQPTHDSVGVASLYAAGGEPVEDYIYAASERVKFVLAQGGAAKLGRFVVVHDTGRV